MNIKIKRLEPDDFSRWDAYVKNHPDANLYHLAGWKNVIEKSYGHKTIYLIAIKSIQQNNANSNSTNSINLTNSTNQIVGILPLVHMKHFIFGNHLISIPFFDMGGILADSAEAEEALLKEAIGLGQQLKVDNIELRHSKPLSLLQKNNPTNSTNTKNTPTIVTKSHKVRMLLKLPNDSEELMKSFKSKLRSQINKPMKEGLKRKIGGLELSDDFYHVFTINMRDLGSPVHTKKIIDNVVSEFSDNTKIVIVFNKNEPVACSLVIGFGNTLENPWASALRQYSRLSPNMLLYWAMLEYACVNGFDYFDFGRSTPDEGTYKFKEQWGAKPQPLNWHYFFLKEQNQAQEPKDDKSKFDKAIQYWQKLPVPLTKIIGPMIRKHIGL